MGQKDPWDGKEGIGEDKKEKVVPEEKGRIEMGSGGRK